MKELKLMLQTPGLVLFDPAVLQAFIDAQPVALPNVLQSFIDNNKQRGLDGVDQNIVTSHSSLIETVVDSAPLTSWDVEAARDILIRAEAEGLDLPRASEDLKPFVRRPTLLAHSHQAFGDRPSSSYSCHEHDVVEDRLDRSIRADGRHHGRQRQSR